MKKRIIKKKESMIIKADTREWLKNMCHFDHYYLDSVPIEGIPRNYLKDYWSNNKRSINGIPKRSIRKQVYNEYKKLFLELKAMTPEEISNYFSNITPWLFSFEEDNIKNEQ